MLCFPVFAMMYCHLMLGFILRPILLLGNVWCYISIESIIVEGIGNATVYATVYPLET